jgi:anti-sigma regulatory factor (Ser/Thr protein kinase)
MHEIDLPPTSSAAAQARRWLDRVLAELRVTDDGTASLLLSELVTNVHLHAGTAATVSVRHDGTALQVAVTDGSPAMPVLLHVGPCSPAGRGLRILDAMAHGWGVEPAGAGKTVWFELRSGPPAP